MRLIVADSGPLIALSSSGHLGILTKIIETVWVPETVFQECVSDLTRPGAREIAQAVDDGEIFRHDDPSDGLFDGIPDLDAGEAAALSLALRLDSPVLMDDAVGRQVARANRIGVVGACGILLKAKHDGLIDALAPVLLLWREAGYFLSDALLEEVLRRADELD